MFIISIYGCKVNLKMYQKSLPPLRTRKKFLAECSVSHALCCGGKKRECFYGFLLLTLASETTFYHLSETTKTAMYRKGKLYFRYGTMGSAKTAMLLTTAYNFEERHMSYLCMKPAIDTREGDRVIHSRIGIERACEWIYPDTDLYRFAKNYFKKEGKLVDWFLVDEAQFLSEQQVDQLSRIVDDFGCNVICYGLRTDFQSHLFEGSRRLFEIADTIDEIKSTCNCGRKTIINARIDAEGNFVSEGAQVEIGGDDRYVAVCRKCWRNKRIEQSSRDVLPLIWNDDEED